MAEAVDIVIMISETVPHAAYCDGPEAGVKVAFPEVRQEVAAGGESAIGLGLEAQNFIQCIFDADVAAVKFCDPVDHVVRAVERFDLPIAFGGDGTVEAEDPDGVGRLGRRPGW
jgi:hypothetical protein